MGEDASLGSPAEMTVVVGGDLVILLGSLEVKRIFNYNKKTYF